MTKLMKVYDIVLNIALVAMILFTGFAIVYYTLPEQTSVVIARALSFSGNPEIAAAFMNYLNGFTIGAGFPSLIVQKTATLRYFTTKESKYGTLTTKNLLSENLSLAEIQIEFQKAEAIRFANSPTMPAKARLYYKSFLEKLEDRGNHILNLKQEYNIDQIPKAIKKVRKSKPKVENIDSTDALI